MAGMGKASASTAAFGKQMTAFGAGMTKFVTLPILALGAASAKFALDFQKPMTDLEALVGMSATEVAGFRKQILALAPAVGKGPRELGEAFYFIASSGLKGEAAMRALKASALAAAAGLGETRTVADAVTSAINAYGEKALSATTATDILVAAVREGKSEPEEFAGSIGRVIPVAAAMGVSFGEVAGTMAALSLNGTDANEAVTQITAGLAQAIKPTLDGTKALKAISMTYADLRKEIADKGLAIAYNEISEALHGNVEEIGKIFPNIRSLRGEMTLTGASAEKYAGIIDEVARAHGDAAAAAAIALEKPGAKLAKAWAGIQAAMIETGDVMLPVLADIAEEVAGLAKAFSGLSEGTKAWVVKLGLAAAAVGPLVLGIAKLVQVVVALRAAYVAAIAAQVALSAAQATGALGTGALLAQTTAMTTALPLLSAAGVAAFAAIAIPAGALLWKLKSIDDDINDIYADIDKGYKALAVATTRLYEMQKARPESVAKRVAAQVREQIMKVTIRTGGTADLDKLEAKMQLFKKFAKFDYPGFSSLTLDIKAGKLKGADLLYTFDQLRTKIISQLKVTEKQADTILRGIFGKKYADIKMPKIDTSPWNRVPTEFERNTMLVVKVAKKNGTWAGRELIAAFVAANKPAPYSVSAAKAAEAIRKKLDTLPGYGRAVGANLANSVAAGISDATSMVALRAERMVARAIARAKAAADAGSPSRKMMQLGGWMAEGLALGMTAGSSLVAAAAQAMVGNVVALPVPAFALSGTAGGTVSAAARPAAPAPSPPATAAGGAPTIAIDARGALFAQDAAEVIADLAARGYAVQLRRSARSGGMACA